MKLKVFGPILISSIALAAAQPIATVSNDVVNTTIVPAIAVFTLLFGILSILKIPKIVGGILSAAIIGGLFYVGIITKFSLILTSLGGIASTAVIIILFIIGVMLISKNKKKTSKIVDYYSMRISNRKQITTGLTNIEKSLMEAEKRMTSLKIQEESLELKFANSKTPDVVKQIERVRKSRNDLADLIDNLQKQREMYKKAYRAAS